MPSIADDVATDLITRQVTYVTLCTEGFGRFVSSTTAPIATGRGESCRVGLPPTVCEKSRLLEGGEAVALL